MHRRVAIWVALTGASFNPFEGRFGVLNNEAFRIPPHSEFHLPLEGETDTARFS